MKLNFKNKKIISLIIFILAILLFSASIYFKPEIECGSSFVGRFYHPDYCEDSCEIDSDCKFVCGCEAININETCFIEGVEISCENPSEIKCINNKCVVLNERDVCKRGGGEWRLFNNGCADSCEYRRNSEEIMCTQALIQGCNCGEGKCWNVEKNICEKI